MYACTLFRGAKKNKRAKLGKKGVFLVTDKFGKDMTDKLRKMYAKTRM